jgi:hypothetical protein
MILKMNWRHGAYLSKPSGADSQISMGHRKRVHVTTTSPSVSSPSPDWLPIRWARSAYAKACTWAHIGAASILYGTIVDTVFQFRFFAFVYLLTLIGTYAVIGFERLIIFSIAGALSVAFVLSFLFARLTYHLRLCTLRCCFVSLKWGIWCGSAFCWMALWLIVSYIMLLIALEYNGIQAIQGSNIRVLPIFRNGTAATWGALKMAFWDAWFPNGGHSRNPKQEKTWHAKFRKRPT